MSPKRGLGTIVVWGTEPRSCSGAVHQIRTEESRQASECFQGRDATGGDALVGDWKTGNAATEMARVPNNAWIGKNHSAGA